MWGVTPAQFRVSRKPGSECNKEMFESFVHNVKSEILAVQSKCKLFMVAD